MRFSGAINIKTRQRHNGNQRYGRGNYYTVDICGVVLNNVADREISYAGAAVPL